MGAGWRRRGASLALADFDGRAGAGAPEVRRRETSEKTAGAGTVSRHLCSTFDVGDRTAGVDGTRT